ncbi:MAG: hypothetical protein KDD47_07110 [Acidobacteria bacterium]|nr:hypothetical protein [Acidobacteriota bacterium]
MLQEPLRITADLRESLKQALILEEDVLTLVQAAPREPMAGPNRDFKVRGALPVPRLMDPETAELRVLEVHVRPLGGEGWEIYAIDGLEGFSE